jgi:hypothetical protein
MKTLPEQLGYVQDPSGVVRPTATVTLRTGREFYVCNPMDELTAAMGAGEPFVAHSIVGMAPIECLVNPPHVATIEAVKS